MRVLVCGSRSWEDRDAITLELTRLWKEDDDVTVIHGDCPGADLIADSIARDLGMDRIRFPANWVRYGERGGPIRNAQMLREGKPDLVLAFPLRGSRGTWGMVNMARRARVPVKVWGEADK